jgi:hypothetical protein
MCVGLKLQSFEHCMFSSFNVSETRVPASARKSVTCKSMVAVLLPRPSRREFGDWAAEAGGTRAVRR